MALKFATDWTATGKHLKFSYLGPSPSGKTGIFGVFSSHDETFLGTVGYLAKWRQYTFDPEANTTYAASCLQDITEFCEHWTKEQKEMHEGFPAISFRADRGDDGNGA